MYIEEEKIEDLTEQRRKEVEGYYYFQRHGEEGWETFNGFYTADEGTVEEDEEEWS